MRDKQRMYLAEWREVREKTQEQLAEDAGVTAMTISRIERGEVENPLPLTVSALAGALELTRTELYTRPERRKD